MDIESVIQEINELIEVFDYKNAKKLSKELVRKKIIDGYYLLATIYDEQDKTDKCMKTLTAGLKRYSNDWILWMRLGNYQSDNEEYDNALDSFKKSLKQNNADKDYININIAILFNRWGKLENATEIIDKVSNDRYSIKKLRVKLSILITNEDYQAVLDSLENDKEIISNISDSDYQDLSLILYFYALAFWKTDNISKAKELIKQSLIYDRFNPQTYWLIREIDNEYSNDNKYFRILLTGDWLGESEDDKKFGFYSSYEIVAESHEKAIELIKEYESAPILKDSIRIDEIKEVNINPQEHPSGIYNVHGFSIFDIEE